jgi:hypothetical protein
MCLTKKEKDQIFGRIWREELHKTCYDAQEAKWLHPAEWRRGANPAALM